MSTMFDILSKPSAVKKPRGKSISRAQKEYILDVMKSHPELVKGKFSNTLKQYKKSNGLWEEISKAQSDPIVMLFGFAGALLRVSTPNRSTGVRASNDFSDFNFFFPPPYHVWVYETRNILVVRRVSSSANCQCGPCGHVTITYVREQKEVSCAVLPRHRHFVCTYYFVPVNQFFESGS